MSTNYKLARTTETSYPTNSVPRTTMFHKARLILYSEYPYTKLMYKLKFSSKHETGNQANNKPVVKFDEFYYSG